MTDFHRRLALVEDNLPAALPEDRPYFVGKIRDLKVNGPVHPEALQRLSELESTFNGAVHAATEFLLD